MAKIDIYLTPKKKRPAAIRLPRRGPLQPARSPEYLPRRLRSGAVNFYDLGQILDGSGWIDLPFSHSPAYSIVRVGPTESGAFYYAWRVPQFGDEQWDSFYDHLFDVPVAEWRGNYRRLGYDLRPPYSLTFNGEALGLTTGGNLAARSDGVWTADGLKLNEATNRVAVSSNIHPYFSFDTADTVRYKVTAVYDPDAPAVMLPSSKNFNVFLIPKVMLQAFSAPGYEMMGYDYRPLPRNGYPLFEDGSLTGTIPQNAVTTGTDPSGLWAAFLNEFKTVRQGNRAAAAVNPGAGGEIPVASFPTTGYWNYRLFVTRRIAFPDAVGLSLEPENFHSDFDSFFYVLNSSPRLAGVIGHGSQFYYVWAAQDRLVGQMQSLASLASNSPFYLSMNGWHF